jgi:hypothetical protein
MDRAAVGVYNRLAKRQAQADAAAAVASFLLGCIEHFEYVLFVLVIDPAPRIRHFHDSLRVTPKCPYFYVRGGRRKFDGIIHNVDN